jgi:hypothetical protein
LRKSGPAAFEVTRSETGDRLELRIDATTPEGAFRNRLPITVTARRPDDSTQSVGATQDAPGSYRAAIDLPEEGTTVIQISSPDLPDGGMSLAHTRSYPREYLSTDTNETLLREIAAAGGGRFAADPREAFASPAVATLRSRDLTNWLLMAALVLMPLDIYLRRRTWAR